MARKGQAIFMVYTDLIDPRYEEEFNAWYNTEHLPELLAVPGILDAARYADTNGYQSDGERSMWPWRDWVIDAFNRNIPFDQFTIEQIAGDMFPHATLDQKIATIAVTHGSLLRKLRGKSGRVWGIKPNSATGADGCAV